MDYPYDYFDDDSPWIECWNCGGECLVDHDCGEDCCWCADPQPNVICDICDGEGGWDRKDVHVADQAAAALKQAGE